MNRATDPYEAREPGALERDIDRTRSSLGRTIDELENRLSPGQLIDQALAIGRRHGGEFATNLGRSVENHPLPLILTAVGLAWMMMSANKPAPPHGAAGERLHGARERLEGGMESAKSAAGAVGEHVSRARGALGSTVSHSGERLQQAGERARLQGERLRGGFARLLEEQPLLVGALGVALGAAIGAALPRTEREDRLMGEARDSAAEGLRQKASEAYEEVRERASSVMPGQEREQAEPGAGSVGSEQAAMMSPEDPAEGGR
ncbi:MAG TPA: DUF3618 domain-containing protein [Woeseiaceae bacterium]|nr:DUF3618 domain-containing protein [Woeseiaceae bacterium]